MENINITLAEGKEKQEIVLREVSTVNELPIKPPIQLKINGNINTPANFLSKRIEDKDQINPLKTLVLVNRNKYSIELIINENDAYNMHSLKGQLALNPEIEELGINTGKQWTPFDLSQKFKMSRFLFNDKSENMNLVSQLSKFSAKIDSSIQKEKSENGSFADNYSAIVTSNMPKDFKLRMPIFYGENPELFEVEFYANIQGRQVLLQLFSPELKEMIDTTSGDLIDEQLEKIKELSDKIAILEV